MEIRFEFHEDFGRYNASFWRAKEPSPVFWAIVAPHSRDAMNLDGAEIQFRSMNDLECIYLTVTAEKISGDPKVMTWKRLSGGVSCPPSVEFDRSAD